MDDGGSIPGARTQRPKSVVRGSATTGKGSHGPMDNSMRLLKPKAAVKGSKS